VALDVLQAELLRVVQETMQPETAILWFKESERNVSHEP
jgi:hypothetical protein